MRVSRLLAGCMFITPLIAGAVRAQERAADSTRAPSAAVDSSGRDSSGRDSLGRDSSGRDPAAASSTESDADTLPPARSALSPFGRLAAERRPATEVAAERVAALRALLRERFAELWRETAAAALGGGTTRAAPPLLAAADTAADTARARSAAPAPAATADTSKRGDIFGDYADLGMQLQARLEAKAERDKNDRCTTSQLFVAGANCRSAFQPNFDFQFNVRSGGVVADRVHVNVDYDSEREFDASNNISVYYEGKPDELVQRLEVGNVSFQLPSSRFITAGVPSGNYGLQAIGQVGPMRFRTIAAQQKGNVVRDRLFTVGDRALQAVERDIEDYQIESRRFFFTVDPRLLAGYPNIDILDGRRMTALAASLPDSLRPTKIYLYRQRIGAQPENPNGPQFSVRGAKNPSRQLYDYLREGVDYYVDPSLLWVTLVQPVSLNTERLAVAYRVRVRGRDTVLVGTGGTPDVEFVAAAQFANLLYEPELTPRDSAFDREIRSVYRIGGEEVRRQTVEVRVTTNSGGDQEKPLAGSADTFLQLFGLAQPTNAASFDVENRLFPRPSDPNFNPSAGGTDSRTVRDLFLVFPSLVPFARAGLATPAPNPANDTIYRTPGEDLYSTRHPQSLYHIGVRYEAEGGGDAGSLSLGSVQLRPNSERLVVDGVPLTRGTDYTVDYDLGRVTFSRPDTLFPRPRQVSVQYEENPLFAASPTSIVGAVTQFPTDHGLLNFTFVSQSQKTAFTRPPLGLEPASSVVAGVSGAFTFDAAPLTRALDRLPLVQTSAPSQVTVLGEFATSRPQPNAAGQAYIESFEGEGGIPIQLTEPNWYYSSQPVESPGLAAVAGVALLDTTRAVTMAWQNNGVGSDRQPISFSLEQIDPLLRTTANGFFAPEPLLWLTLYPLRVGGLLDDETQRFRWRIPDAPRDGYRWRSIRTTLAPSGVDLSRVETLEFWALVDTTAARRAHDPTLVFDFGEISENSVAFAPETLTVAAGGRDSAYTGKRLQGLDVLDSERDPFSRSFDVSTNDRGLPGDVIDRLTVVTPAGTTTADSVVTCSRGNESLRLIGDHRTDCTVRNSRLDEEDLDLDHALNLTSAARGREQILRYVVDLGKASNSDRVGRCDVRFVDSLVGRNADSNRLCWVHYRVPFSAPTDSINGPQVRRIKALRVTMIAGREPDDTAFTTVPIARLRLVGSPWLKRAERTLAGLAGDSADLSGLVVASEIGTQDSTKGLTYQSPPGVTDAPDTRAAALGAGQAAQQINERSLRITAVVPGGSMPLYHRAEAYFRFPEGQKNFMGYKELRVWARGRNHGWGVLGELQFYVKVGRDVNSFYLYRTPVNSGRDQGAWLPEVRVDFQRFYQLRTQIQNAYLRGGRADRFACAGVDSALIVNSGLPAGVADSSVYAACRDGYVVYTLDPGVAPPNLAAVQELAVGMVRVAEGTGPNAIAPSDTLELWVDDLRLGSVVDAPGYAGQFGVSLTAGDVADVRATVSRRDPNFRQLAEQPTFLTDDNVDVASSFHLEKFLPERLGVALPFTVSHSTSGSDPLFIARSDVRGDGIDGLRTPKTSATSYSLGLRRLVPMRSSLVATIVNNLALDATYATADSRSEYQTGRTSNYTLGLDYNVAAEPRVARAPWLERVVGRLPRWMAESELGRALRGASVRWSPAQFRLTSGVARNVDRRSSFLKPAATPTDSARVITGLTNVWRNGSALELRPTSSTVIRWDLTSLMDLRHYADSGASGVSVAGVAAAERSRLLGLDVGLERERAMRSSVSIAPPLASWIRPRLDFGTAYTMNRDPNARTALRDGDSTGAYRLPRRLTNSQTFTAAATVDLAQAVRTRIRDSSLVARFASAFQPVDVTFNRSLLSAFDGTPLDPPLSYQLAFGGVRDFRRVGGRLATSAGLTTQVGVTSTLTLPFGWSVANRYQRVDTRSWTRRQNDTQAVIDGAQRTFPDLSLRWSASPPLLRTVISNVGAQLRATRTRQTSFAPAELPGAIAVADSTTTTSYPLNGSITWAFAGVSTSGGYTHTRREDARPGNASRGSTDEVSLDVAKPFRLPPSWGAKSDLRTSIGYQRSATQSFVLNPAAESRRSVLTDNGRNAVTLKADTDLSATATFSLVGSRVISFDRQFNRRFTQTVLSAVLQLQFYGGEMK